ncbi:MAG: D-tyrosyl-tRNA(Tyr) deacylase [Bacteroidales bacterium]|jgi:D-tyrosyl-tRNA(Tyr) deacylase|nr:D-tyrosyl-tRNA(Tyr) deacylase [Bacteroidales bacterium]NPV35801.1 D-tyrosyl-tRNA(Tyr) deacylase [Bacteroidales bacterium]
MRVVVQRVNYARVEVESRWVGAIGMGLLILCGFEEGDTEQDLEWMSGKISRLRIFNDENGVMNLSIKDVNGEILSVSQFTLHASTKKGNRPSYIRAMNPEMAAKFYEKFNHLLKSELGINIKTGIFGAYMKVALENDGPVTIIIDSKNKE